MKHARLIIILFAALVLGFLSVALFHNREPRYQGRTLTEWIEDAASANMDNLGAHNGDMHSLTNDPTWQAASRAVKQMASDAIPWLLKSLQIRDSSLKRKMAYWLEAHPSLHFQIRRDFEYNGTAVQGLILLGDDASAAWPVLIQLTQSSDANVRRHALMALAEAKFDKEIWLSVLTRSIHDPVESVRKWAALMYFKRFPEEAKAAGALEISPLLKKLETEHQSTNQLRSK